MNRDEMLQKLARVLDVDDLRDARSDIVDLLDAGEVPDWLSLVMEAAEQLPMPAVPEIVSSDLRAIMDPPELVAFFEATVMVDSRDEGRLAGVRGGPIDDAWSITYTSEPVDLVVDVWPSADGGLEVEGQVLARSDTPSVFRATLTGDTSHHAGADALGRFAFGAVTPGAYQLMLDDGRVRVSAPVDLREVAE